MGKSGPCCHCGITSTPLWRNGPPGKPVLCNACGSRWRTKGTLENYTPLHCHGFLPVGSEFCRKSQENNLSLNTNARSLHMNQNEVYAQDGDTVPGHESKTGHEDDTSSNGSSSGSGLSISESCILGSMDGNSISGPVQSHLWNSYIPSRKRTINKCQSPSPVEKLRRDLYNILQEQKSTYLSGSLEEVLLFERDDLMLSVETDLGSILLKHPSSSGEEESEASSLMIRNKVHCLSDTNLRSSFSCVPSQSCEVTSSPRGKRKVLPHAEQKVEIKEHPVKRRALADILLEEIPVNNLNAFERNHSPQRSKVLRSKNEDLKLEKETSSCSSKIVGGATALLPGRALSQQDTSSCSSRSVRGPTTLPTRRPLSQQQYQISGVEKGSVNAQNHGATNLHLLQASSRTIGVFRKGMMPIK